METDTTCAPLPTTPTGRPPVVNAEILDNPDLIDRIFQFITDEFPDMQGRAAELKDMARREFAGIETYIPRRSQAERDQIVREVMRLFDGRNASEVARRLSISRASVYRIIKTDGRVKK